MDNSLNSESLLHLNTQGEQHTRFNNLNKGLEINSPQWNQVITPTLEPYYFD